MSKGKFCGESEDYSHSGEPQVLPSKYKVLKEMGKGGFGQVLKCLDKDTDTVVAIKVPQHMGYCEQEVDMLKKLMKKKLNQHNIITYHESFKAKNGDALVFECLDLSLQDLLIQNRLKPMELEDIRDITEQMARALKALKKVKVIHTDIKLDNIMLEKDRSPYNAKLIDFGLAMNASETKKGMNLQTLYFRAPEMILGLPFSGAIDMWSLGCVLFTILTGRLFITSNNENEAIHFLSSILGMPSNKLLDQGKYTTRFFTKTKSKNWLIKESGVSKSRKTFRSQTRLLFTSLDDLKRIAKLNGLKEEKYEMYEDCIELLKAMLTMDPSKRITPDKVLKHPFITKYRPCTKKTIEIKTHPTKKTISPVDEATNVASAIPRSVMAHDCPASTSRNKVKSNIRREETIPSSMYQKHQNAPPMVFPCSVTAHDCPAAASKSKVKSNIRREETIPSSMDQKHQNAPPTGFPSGVILVKPAKPENMLRLQDEEEPQPEPKPTAEEKPSSLHFAKPSLPEDSKEKTKEKNWLQRLWSGMKSLKRKFCCNCVDVIG